MVRTSIGYFRVSELREVPPHLQQHRLAPSRRQQIAEEGKSGVRVCVTGGAGFIGSWLVKKLLEAGGRGESRAGAAARPRRRAGGAAGAVRGRPLRRRQLRAGHRQMPVRLPRRHTVHARGRRLQVQNCGRSRRRCGSGHPPAMRGIQDGEAGHPHRIGRFAADGGLRWQRHRVQRFHLGILLDSAQRRSPSLECALRCECSRCTN